MKSKKEIEKKLRKLSYREYLKMYEEKASCKPENCVHNYRHEEDGEEVGLCMLGADNVEEWPGNICDDVSTAKQCPFFRSKQSKEQVKEEFFEKLEKGDIEDENPSISALKWVLEEEYRENLSVWEEFKFSVFRFLIWVQVWLRV